MRGVGSLGAPGGVRASAGSPRGPPAPPVPADAEPQPRGVGAPGSLQPLGRV